MARQRREQSSRRDRQGQWIILGTLAVMAVVAVIVLAGLIWASWLPPRAHVLTVGTREFRAQDVVDRAHYLAAGGNSAALQSPTDEGIRSLTRQQILLEFGAPLVDPVTADDIQRTIAQRLGVPFVPVTESSEVTPAEGTPAAGEATETPEAPAGAAETEFDPEVFAAAYRDFLRSVPIERRAFEELIRAGIIEERLEARFKEELPETGDQFRLRALRVNQRTQAQALVDAVAAGEGFAEAAVRLGIIESVEQAPDLGWFAPEALDERIRDAIAALSPGETTAALDDANRVGFEVFFMEERTSTEPYDPDVVTRLAVVAVNRFIETHEETEGVVRAELSSGERSWINRQVERAMRRG